MAFGRLSDKSLQKLEAILATYNADTNPQNAAESKRNFGHSGQEGRQRFETVLFMFAKFNGDMRQFRHSEVDQGEITAKFLKDLCALAFAAYQSSWLKSAESLYTKLLMFLAEEFQMSKIKYPKQHVVAYAAPVFKTTEMETESDEAFFKRVSERVNMPAAVKKFLDATPMRSLTSIYVPAAQVAMQEKSEAQTPAKAKNSEVVFPRAGFPGLR